MEIQFQDLPEVDSIQRRRPGSTTASFSSSLCAGACCQCDISGPERSNKQRRHLSRGDRGVFEDFDLAQEGRQNFRSAAERYIVRPISERMSRSHKDKSSSLFHTEQSVRVTRSTWHRNKTCQVSGTCLGSCGQHRCLVRIAAVCDA